MGRYSYMARLQRTEEAARKLNLGTTRSLARAQYGAQTPDAKGRLG